jgi:hypothetical protein
VRIGTTPQHPMEVAPTHTPRWGRIPVLLGPYLIVCAPPLRREVFSYNISERNLTLYKLQFTLKSLYFV